MTGCATRCHMSKLTVERHEIIELLGQLKLAGMRAAYDEVVASGLRAQHSFQRIFGELLLAQLADHRARSVVAVQLNRHKTSSGARKMEATFFVPRNSNVSPD